MNKSLLIAALALTFAPSRAQNTAAFVDAYDALIVFESGEFDRVEGQRPAQFAVEGDQLGYIAYNGDVRVRAHGLTTTLEHMDGIRPFFSPHYIAYNNNGTLKVWDGRKLNTVCTSTDAFLAQDSLVAFYDGVHSLLNVFYNGEVILLEDALANDPVNNWKASGNVLAWVTNVERKFKVFYHGEIYELNDLVRQADFQVGLDIVAYRDASDQGFKIFHHGNLHDVEPFMPKSFQCGAGLVAYVDQSDELKVFQNGKVYTALDFAPTSYQVIDSLVVIQDNDHLLLFHDGVTTMVTQYVPEKWTASWGSFAYIDNSNNVVVWRNGRSVIALRGGPYDQLTFERGVVLTTRGSTTQVWWNGTVYSY